MTLPIITRTVTRSMFSESILEKFSRNPSSLIRLPHIRLSIRNSTISSRWKRSEKFCLSVRKEIESVVIHLINYWTYFIMVRLLISMMTCHLLVLAFILLVVNMNTNNFLTWIQNEHLVGFKSCCTSWLNLEFPPGCRSGFPFMESLFHVISIDL